MSITASEAGIVVKCAAAQNQPEVRIDSDSPEAQLGRETHDILQGWIENKEWPAVHLNDKALQLAFTAEPLLERIAAVESITCMVAEVSLSDDLVRGRLDVLSRSKEHCTIIDWKTGRSEYGKYRDQMLSYASVVANEGMPDSGYIYAAEVYLAEDRIIDYRFTAQDINNFRRKLIEQFERPDKFEPGEHCRWCRLRAECFARDQWLRSSAAAIAEVKTPMSAAKMGELWDKSRALKRAIEAYEKAVDALLKEGPLPLPDGKVLRLSERTKKVINARKAWPVMRKNGMTDDDIAKVLTVKNTTLMKAVKDKNALWAALDEAGAVKTSKYYSKIKAKG